MFSPLACLQAARTKTMLPLLLHAKRVLLMSGTPALSRYRTDKKRLLFVRVILVLVLSLSWQKPRGIHSMRNSTTKKSRAFLAGRRSFSRRSTRCGRTFSPTGSSLSIATAAGIRTAGATPVAAPTRRSCTRNAFLWSHFEFSKRFYQDRLGTDIYEKLRRKVISAGSSCWATRS